MPLLIFTQFHQFLEQLMPLDSWKSGMELLPREASSKHIASLLDSHTPVTTIARCIANDSSEEEEGMNGVRLMAMGAPEELLRNCTTVRTATMDEVPLSDELLLQFEVREAGWCHPFIWHWHSEGWCHPCIWHWHSEGWHIPPFPGTIPSALGCRQALCRAGHPRLPRHRLLRPSPSS